MPDPAAKARRTQRAQRLRDFLATRDIPCPQCRYNLRGLTTSACPECGFGFDIVTIRLLSRPAPSWIDILSPLRAIVLLVPLAIARMALHDPANPASIILNWPFRHDAPVRSLYFIAICVLISIWGAIENTDLPMLLSRSTTPRLMWWLPRVIAAMLALHLALVVLLAIGRM